MTRVTIDQHKVLDALSHYERPIELSTITARAGITQKQTRATLVNMPNSWVEQSTGGRYIITGIGEKVLAASSKQHNSRPQYDDYMAERYSYTLPAAPQGRGRR